MVFSPAPRGRRARLRLCAGVGLTTEGSRDIMRRTPIVSSSSQERSLDTASIHITRWGNSGPRVIMVHGGAQGSAVGGERNFSAQKPLAARGWQLILPDRPGHGQSPDPGRPDDAEADGAWVAELVGGGAHLVGHSFGGCVALAAAVKRPAVVRSLTLIEPGMLKFATSSPHVKRFVFRLLLTTLLSPSPASRAERFANLIGLPPEIRGRYDREELKRVGRSLARGKIPSKSTIARELTETKRAGIPLLVVTGGWSPAFEATGDMVAAAGGGQRAVIQSGHHFPQLMSDEFNEILMGFLEKSDAKQKA